MDMNATDRIHSGYSFISLCSKSCFCIPGIYAGGTMVIEEAFSPEQALNTMEKEDVTIFLVCRRCIVILLNTPKMANTYNY